MYNNLLTAINQHYYYSHMCNSCDCSAHRSYIFPLQLASTALRASRIQSRALEEGAVKGSTSAQASAGNLHLTKLDNEAFRPLQEAEWIDEEVMGDLLNHLRKTLNATGVYLARYEEQAGLKNGELAPGLRYVAADNSHLHMLDQCLMEDEGITCDLLRQEEPAEATAEKSDSPEASEDEDEEAPPRNLSDVRAAFVKVPLGSIVGHLGTSLRLNTLFVEEVMDNPRIRFFGLIRPGSYAAVSLEFDNVASPASVATLFTWLEEKQGRERALISAQQSGETAHANSRESADEDTGTSFEAEVERNEGALEAGEDPLPPVQLSTTPARYILSVDFLGSETTSRLPTILRLEDFAKELGSALIKTQIKAVERQARELLQETVAVEELAQLVQNSAQKLEALQRVRQAEALERLEAEEADGARELKSSREDFFPVGKGDHGPAQNGNEQNKKDSLSDDVDAEKRVKQPEEKNSMEEEQDAPDEPLVRLPRDLVLEVARAHAALEVFNAEVLSIFKPKFTLCRKYIPDSPALVSVAAACALILGYKPEGLRKKSARGREWSWDRIRRLLDPSFVEAMLAFDPKGKDNPWLPR
ncbi:hypothetical protein Esti_003605 [Eimeria stiedai]